MTLPDPDGSGPLTSPVWTYSYNTLGQRYQTTDPLNHVQTTSFDGDGNTTSVLDNLGHGPTYAYGHGGELLTSTDSLSHTTSVQYDSRYRLIQTTAADGGVTQITLDAAGNRIKLVDPANNQTSWTVDALNRPVTETNSLGTTTTTYDASSDVTSITDADGRVRDFAYDNLHRLTAENWMSGNTIVATMAYAYDGASQLTSASDPNSAYAFGYNNDGAVLTVDNAGTPNVPHVVLTSTVDAMGDRTSLSAAIAGTADFLNSYSYDADQRLTMLQQQQQTGGNTVAYKEVDFAYNALGQFTTIGDYNYNGGPRTDVLTGAYSYDTANRLTGLTYTANGGATHIDAFGWSYDAADNVTSFTTASGTASYGYDVTNQLTSATYTGTSQPANESYSFDKNGNRAMSGYSTGSNNLMTSDGTFNYTHDADGNQTVRTRISNSYATDYRTTYAWDYRNRLTDVEYYDNNGVLTKHVHYVYDVFDHLLATEVDATGGGTYNQIERYVLDVSPESPVAGTASALAADVALEFDKNGNLAMRYLALERVFAEGTVSSTTQADAVTWNIVDNLDSARYVLDNSSNIADKLVYNSTGIVAYESNASVDHFIGFAGGHFDPSTGLVNDYHRWYDATEDRWLSEDPAGFAARDPNLSRYAGNDPTNATDASGLAVPPGPGLGGGGPTNPTPAGGGNAPTELWYQNQEGNWVWGTDGFNVVITLCSNDKHAMGYILTSKGKVVGQFLAKYGQDGVLQPALLPAQKLAEQNAESSPLKFNETADGEWAAEMSAPLAKAFNGALEMEIAAEKQITNKQRVSSAWCAKSSGFSRVF